MQESQVRLIDWISKNITNDPRALEWFGRGPSPDPEEELICEKRVVKAYRELLSGYEIDPSKILKITRKVALGERVSKVTIADITYYSMCAHHFLPFFGKIDIEYLPGDRILGLGKFPRLVQAYARRFQIQEDLVKEIAEEIMDSGHARAVRVVSDGRHLCMCSRGPSDGSAYTRTEYETGSWSV
ncbi:MAG: GTP cyclohydrolase I [Bdellovibrionales bacterium]|nr:GTP cyclohydrolase I [Bdellovibrionales bacterium]